MQTQLKNFNSAKEGLLEKIRLLREQKGKEKQALALINKSLKKGQDFVIELLWEEALIHQHSYMTKPSHEALQKMEGSVKTAGYFIQKFGLKNYRSRLERYLGRLNDYKGNFKDSVKNYKKAIKYARLDPFYLSEEKPIWLELEGFLSYALLMSGGVEAGLSMAQKAYQNFEEKEGRQLKTRDYPTWAIWRSGIPIRIVEGLIKKREKSISASEKKSLEKFEKGFLKAPRGLVFPAEQDPALRWLLGSYNSSNVCFFPGSFTPASSRYLSVVERRL